MQKVLRVKSLWSAWRSGNQGGTSTMDSSNLTPAEFLVHTFDEKAENGSFWASMFMDVNHRSSIQEKREKLTVNDAKRNAAKNRYANVWPYDHSRVRLHGDDATDFINASLISRPDAKRSYILTQGPLAETAHDFWRMVWEQKCQCIVMLNSIYEQNMKKCEQYFPIGPKGATMQWGGWTLELEEEVSLDVYTKRRVRIYAPAPEPLEANAENGNGDESQAENVKRESRVVTHLQFTGWPDFGVPLSTDSFLEFLDVARVEAGLVDPSGGGAPHLVVHCSAGIGRTGTFILADIVLSIVENPSHTTRVDPAQELVALRKSRMGLIQTPGQLHFCWHAIADRLRRSLKSQAPTASVEDVDDTLEAALDESDEPAAKSPKPSDAQRKLEERSAKAGDVGKSGGGDGGDDGGDMMATPSSSSSLTGDDDEQSNDDDEDEDDDENDDEADEDEEDGTNTQRRRPLERPSLGKGGGGGSSSGGSWRRPMRSSTTSSSGHSSFRRVFKHATRRGGGGSTHRKFY